MPVITFPLDTKDTIDAIRTAIGRNINFVTTTVSGCSVCSLDPVTNGSTDPFCLTCSGVYWITQYITNTILAHVFWGPADFQNWQTGGILLDGDCKAQIEYTAENLAVVDNTEYVIVDGKRLFIKNKHPRGVPTLNRILINLVEEKDDG